MLADDILSANNRGNVRALSAHCQGTKMAKPLGNIDLSAMSAMSVQKYPSGGELLDDGLWMMNDGHETPASLRSVPVLHTTAEGERSLRLKSDPYPARSVGFVRYY